MNTIFRSNQIEGTITAKNEVYTIRDNFTMKHLVLSNVILHAGQKTRGHHHNGQEEVYFFVSGIGRMTINDYRIEVGMGDVIIVPDGLFHRVENTGDSDLVFNTVYNKVDKSTTIYAA